MTIAPDFTLAPALFRARAAAPERTLLDVLADTARRHPDAPAVDDGTTALTYRALLDEVDRARRELAARGIGVGDRVGIRVPSGTVDLYVSILAVLAAGAAYVPVDAEDPDERAELVFSEAGACAVLVADRELVPRGAPMGMVGAPGPDDDAWIIFTSGSTGKPKGVAVSHRSAAAFVDAEARLFLADEPIGPDDRVLAGLSVAFDASCEEMWLAWRHGACLVPAPRSLVRTGMDLGPWLVEQEITVVSTVPTLAALWPVEALDDVRLLIFGGEACPPELAERLAVDGREVWNTYGPTEATVVACAAPLTGDGPVRIGLPLDGWELAVVDADGRVVPMGGTGELVIGGVGLARYLDQAKDAEKFAPLPALGWSRAYRSGDLVKAEEAGLLFLGRADEQVKLGGRRIELGEVDAALQALPGVAGAAAAVRTTRGGNQVLVGYVVAAEGFDQAGAVARLRAALPAALVPLLAVVDTLPTRTSGKVDRAALPWPLPALDAEVESRLEGTEAWLAEQWAEVLGSRVAGADADFFASGGGSLAAAQLVSLVRARHAGVSVSDVYQHPTLRALARRLDELAAHDAPARVVAPTPRRTAVVQALLTVPLMTVAGLRWTVALAAIGNVLGLMSVSWWWVAAGWVAFVSPPGKLAVAAGGARLLLRGVRPGSYPRGGGVHVRLWAAERLAEFSGATNLAGSWITHYARALGAKVGPDVDLHSLPPVTGLLKLGRGCAIEPEVDLSGTWVDGDRVHVGRIRVGAGATVGARSTLLPGARIGKRAEVAPGSGVVGSVPTGQRWAGVPAQRTGKAARPGPRPPRSPWWQAVYGVTTFALGLLPAVAALPALLLVVRGPLTLGSALLAVPLATVAWLVSYALLVLVSVRLLGVGLRAGVHPVHSRVAWRAWTTERLMNMARVALFPLYASLFTPVWLRALGMRVGRGVEASTVLALPKMTKIGDGAFLADDTMVASYELGGGWLRIASARVGKRAFLGNSGMTAPGRAVPNRGLVGVLSAAPKRAKAGSSYLGMPPMKLPRATEEGDQSRTFDPPRRLVVARALVELCRVVPVMCHVALVVLVLFALRELGALAPLLAGAVLLAAGVLACAVAVLAKWVLVGRFRRREYPLWSAFVWRNELADTFVEVLAVPWLVGSAGGSPLMGAWLRALGARIGRGTWVESHWFPESDLVSLGDGAAVNRGCVVQTHLFHDRILRMDRVELAAGATLGPHGIVLPGATVGAHTTVGPASLVMRGEEVPAGSRWLGNPISAWR
ncbi:Pls/PosA family non-ribosomal peptide synthetase [Saccharothrix algeriensis]|uniref:Amino acid adenylation domain-containing protein n=1 Tax=Saccharothrix algeriensis TaxID=173560 RepID=A0A8T8HYU7_9PSEU|nr:Pls/PosA family non-ribosomal peptide synthetase [Saccharothrix algeriensis]MBM7809254.1 non-ribosomal peptide synthetase-like protein [Saccharothrix algeriensis]QTR03608.1 amino acid adenylation domain-containing protein [Saccharothrix algeriensis]